MGVWLELISNGAVTGWVVGRVESCVVKLHNVIPIRLHCYFSLSFLVQGYSNTKGIKVRAKGSGVMRRGKRTGAV